MRTLTSSLVLFIVLAAASDVRAQGGGRQATPAERAAVLDAAARDAIESRRFAEAADLLRRSLETHPAAPAAFNLARVLREQGRPTEALTLVQALWDGDYGELPRERQEQLRTIEQLVRGDLAQLTIETSGADVEVRIDGQELRAVTRDVPVTVVLDPGVHRVVAVPGDEHEVSLARGARERIVLEAEAETPRPAPVLAPSTSGEGETVPDDDDGGGIASSPWLWLGVGLAVIAGGVIATVLIVSANDGGSTPLEHPVLGHASTLVSF